MFGVVKSFKIKVNFMKKQNNVSKNTFKVKQKIVFSIEKGFTLKTTRLSKANYFDPNRPQVQILTRVSNEVLGREDTPFIMSGGTYASKLPDAFAFGTGMPLPPRPVEIFRPGHGDYHQPDESISLERMRKGLEIYIKGLLQIDF